MSAIPIACRIDALNTEQRALHAGQLRQLQAAVREVEELSIGYAFASRPPARTSQTPRHGSRSSGCAARSLDFAIDLEAGEDTLRLRLTGPEGAKAILAAAMPPARR